MEGWLALALAYGLFNVFGSQAGGKIGDAWSAGIMRLACSCFVQSRIRRHCTL